VIVRLEETRPNEAGGKATGLRRLVELGLPVPPAVVVPISARGAVTDDEVRAVVAQLGEPLAVRSSAAGEDAADRSAAGQYESVAGVRGEGLAAAVRRVWESGASERAIAYAGEAAPMAVVVQREVASTRAGVAFSHDPLSEDDAVLIESVFGHGERMVSGLADPDRFWVGADGAVRARLADKDGARRLLRTLRDDEACAVADLTRRAEAGFRHPVDVEFCFEGRALWLVQCRAITTFAAAG
jgi:phosphoenolpyruvate synthase/pyruvate phosphate dikinase